MILVIGGTGLVGRNVLRRLLSQGESVRVLSRSISPALPDGVEHVAGDVRDEDSLRRAMTGVEAVIYAVAVIRERGQQTYQSVNVRGVQNAVHVATEMGVRRFLYMSTLGAQNTPSLRYLYSRWLGERAVRQSGLAYTIFKPSVLFGESFGLLDWLVQAIKATPPPFVVLPDGGRARFQPLWVQDLVTCLLHALREDQTIEKVYELGGPRYWTFREMMDLVLRLRGHRRLKVSAPRQVLVPSVLGMGLVYKDPPVTLEELKQLAVDNTTDLDSVERNFGFTPEPLERHVEYVKHL